MALIPSVPLVPSVPVGFDLVPCTYKQARVMVRLCKDPTHLPGHFNQALRFFMSVMEAWDSGQQPFLVGSDEKQRPLDHPHRVSLRTMNPEMMFRVSVQPPLEAQMESYRKTLGCTSRAEFLASVWDYYLFVLKTMWRLKADVKMRKPAAKQNSKAETVGLLTLKRLK